ncbi:winged helix-turn-helix domain-containing protein [Streptomyces sp. GXMU-J15]|uniref:Winged helix-turn-helix domain-containing protein n=1 Tax=Streptomyces fuscus TaxID=3048495 RepID=A0ABT7J6R7_9ACTN|nr:winged helix-turn-helix domain-containing protein [Streptomyces fuscus]MDL2080551.1 winged helix-turn-helix domain-containing protein [Streptomyces fuscus]
MAGEVQRIVAELLGRMAAGVYAVGSFLPPQRQLAQEFEVSRTTIQQALRQLADDGYIESRVGSGSRVARISPDGGPVRTGQRHDTLGPCLDTAFTAPTVTVDMFSLTGEVLDAHLRVCADRVRSGEAEPQSISLRALTPRIDADFKPASPVNGSANTHTLSRLRQLRETHMDSLAFIIGALKREGLVGHTAFEWRDCSVAPMQKLYLLNGTDLVTGFYEVVRRPVGLPDGKGVEIHDVNGLGVTLHRFSAVGENSSPGDEAVIDRARLWFEDTWLKAEPVRVR